MSRGLHRGLRDIYYHGISDSHDCTHISESVGESKAVSVASKFLWSRVAIPVAPGFEPRIFPLT